MGVAASSTTGRLAAVLTLGVLALGTAATAGAQEAGDSEPTVEAARQVTADANPARLFNQPVVAVDPRDPATVAVAAGDTRNGGCPVRVSRDGGLSWGAATSPMPSDRPFCIQRNFGAAIDIAFASDGTLYMGMSGSSAETDPPHPNGVVDALAARSTDLGQSWEASTIAEGTTLDYELRDGTVEEAVEHNKYNSVAVAPDDPDLVYRGWKWTVRGVDQGPVPGWSLGCPDNCAPERPLVSVSTDGGESWSEPVDLLDEAGLDDVFGGDYPELVVADDGTVHAFLRERPDRGSDQAPRFFMFTSTDGGSTWSARTIYEDVPQNGQPSAAVAPDTGALYLVWEQRGDDRDNPSDAYFMASTDGGASWTEATSLIDEDAASYNQYLPGISVAPSGRIDVAWYDFRNDPFFTFGEPGEMGTTVGERYWDVYHSWSTDGGSTWSPNQRVTDRSVDGEVGVTFANQDIRGPIGVASTDGAAMFTWSDARAGGPETDVEDAYFARARFAAPAATVEDGGTPAWVWAGLGAGIALLAGGLLLFAGVRSARRGTAARA